MSLQALLAAGLLAGAFAGGWSARGVLADRDEAQAAAQLAADINRRALRAQEVSDAAYLQTQTRVAAVRRADTAGNGLRIAAQAAAAPAEPAGQCDATARAALVLADLLAEVERAGRDMALTADERGAAGSACERTHEALTP